MTTIDISTPAYAGFALAHCAECGMFLRPDEGCLHMKPVHHETARLANRDAAAPVFAPFHAEASSPEAHRNHG